MSIDPKETSAFAPDEKTSNIFSTPLNSKLDYGEMIEETRKIKPVKPTDGVPDPREDAPEKDTIYETPQMRTRPTSAYVISPSSIFGLIKNGLSNSISSLGASVKGFDIPNILEGFNTVKRTYTFDEYEKKMGMRINLIPSNNPMQFPTQWFIDKFVNELTGKYGTIDHIKEEAERLDGVRRKVYDLSKLVSDAYPPTYRLLSRYERHRYPLLNDFKDKMARLYEKDSTTIKPGSNRDQLLDLTNFTSSFHQQMTLGFAKSPLDEAGKLDFTTNVEPLFENISSEIEKVVSKYTKDLLVLMDDIRENSVVNGPFNPLGEDQKVKYDNDKMLKHASNPIYKNFRTEYIQNCMTSVSPMSTDFSQSGMTRADVMEGVETQTPTDLSVAVPADGMGDKTQASGAIGTVPYGSTVGPFTDGQWQLYVNTLGQRESSNNYRSVNTLGYMGRWQMGAGALIDSGYVRPGTSLKQLEWGGSNVWTGKDGINSGQDFLNSKDAQDKNMLAYTRRNYKGLIRLGVINANTHPAEVAGYLGASHIGGTGGARSLKNGRDRKDAYGGGTREYYNLLKGAFVGSA